MHENQRISVIQQTEHAAVNGDQRDHDYLERNDHRKHHQKEQEFIDLPVFSYKDVSAHGRKQNNQKDTDTCYQKRVLKYIQEIQSLEGCDVVVNRESLLTTEAERQLCNITLILKGVQHDHEKRKHIKQEQQYRNHRTDNRSYFAGFYTSSLIHYASTSFRLFITA